VGVALDVEGDPALCVYKNSSEVARLSGSLDISAHAETTRRGLRPCVCLGQANESVSLLGARNGQTQISFPAKDAYDRASLTGCVLRGHFTGRGECARTQLSTMRICITLMTPACMTPHA
jgi:hypothetical protein